MHHHLGTGLLVFGRLGKFISLVPGHVGCMVEPQAPGITHQWSDLQTSVEKVEDTNEDVDALDAELDALLGIDDGPSVAQLQGNRFRTKVPTMARTSRHPLSFLIMAFRFLGLALSGRFEETYALPAPASDGQTVALTRPNTRGARDLIIAGLIPGILIGLVATLGIDIPTLIFMGAILLILVGAPLFLTVGVASVACVTLIHDISGWLSPRTCTAVKKEELLAILSSCWPETS